jgi:hypothetical protein
VEPINERSTHRATPKSRLASVTPASELLRTPPRTSSKPPVSEETFDLPSARFGELVEPGYGIQSHRGTSKRTLAPLGLRKESEKTFANSGDLSCSEEPFWKPVTIRFWNPKIPSTHRQQTASEFSGRITIKPRLRVWTPKNPSTKCRPDSEHPGAPVRASCSHLSSEELVTKPSTHNGTHKLVHELLSHGVSCPHDVSEMGVATFTEPAELGYAAPSGFLNLLTPCSTLIRTALSHAESVHRVEALRGFPLPVAATAFTARCPPARGDDPPANASTSLRRATPQRRHDVTPRKLRDSCTWEVRSRRSGVTQPRRPILSQPCAPLRISPLEPRPQQSRASSHGLFHSTGQVH